MTDIVILVVMKSILLNALIVIVIVGMYPYKPKFEHKQKEVIL